MVNRLSATDTALLYADAPVASSQLGGVVILDGANLDYDRIAAHVSERLNLVPRSRQRVRQVPGRLARPVWVDDENFDLAYHLRRSAIPQPGTDASLDELVARLISRPLDLSRPLWEMYVVEGLSGGRIALVSKTHEAMVDRLGAVELAAAVLDLEAAPEPLVHDAWIPEPEPSGIDLMLDAVSDLTARPSDLIDVARLAAADLRTSLGKLGEAATGIAQVLRQSFLPAPPSALGGAGGSAKRFARHEADLEQIRAIRRAHGGTVNDVVLAVLSGALRQWLLSRGEPVGSRTDVRALVPMSIRGGGDTQLVTTFLLDLPVSEPNAVMRLHQVAYQTKVHTDSGRQVGADALLALGRFSPPTLHALGARVGATISRRSYHLLVTNVPGPQQQLYVAGSPVLSMYPIAPLVPGQALAVACTSYHGAVYYGLTADRDAMGDVDAFAQLLGESLAELAGTVPAGATKASRPKPRAGKPAAAQAAARKPVARQGDAAARAKTTKGASS